MNPFDPTFDDMFLNGDISTTKLAKTIAKSDMIYAYQQTFACSAPLASKLVQMTKGYVYAFQLLGYLLYEQCQGQAPTA